MHLQWQMLGNLLQSPVLFSSMCQPLQGTDHTILNTHLPLEREMCETCKRTFYKWRLREKGIWDILEHSGDTSFKSLTMRFIIF